MEDIDSHQEELENEYKEYNQEMITGDSKSLMSRVKTEENAYNYSIANGDRMDKINQSLMKINPMLPAPSDDPDYKSQFSAQKAKLPDAS